MQKKRGLFAALLIATLAALSLFATACGGAGLLSRPATNNDVTIRQSVEASLSNLKDTYIVKPKTDIKDLQITFAFYDENRKLLSQQVKSVGYVRKDMEYPVSVEHSITELFRAASYTYTVSGSVALVG